MSITYTTNIPLAANNPSSDQPNMQVNTNAVNSWVQIDHVGFNASNGGQHKQVTFPAENTPGTPTGSVGILYTQAGIADAAHPTLQFVNANLTFPVSLIRAYAAFSGTTGAILNSQSQGIASIVRNGLGLYTITLNANVVSSTTYGIFFNTPAAATIVSTTVFTINNGGIDLPDTYFFVTQL